MTLPADDAGIEELPAAETPVATVHVASHEAGEAAHGTLNDTLTALNGSIAALNIAVSSIHEELKNAHATAAPIVEPAVESVAPATAAAEEIAPEVVPPAAESRKVRRNGRMVKRG